MTVQHTTRLRPEWFDGDWSDKVEHYASREEWLADARTSAPDHHIGASTAYRMLCGAFGGLWGVIHERKSGTRPNLDDNDAVSTGLRLEPVALAEYSLRTGVDAWTPGYHRVGADWFRVSPDSWGMDPEHGLGFVENKVPMPNQMRYWANNEEGTRGDLLCPERYEVQALAQYTAALLAGVPVQWVDCWAWFGPHIYRRVRYWFTREQAASLYTDLSALRAAFIVGDERPAIDETDECKAELMRDWSEVGRAECPETLVPLLHDLHVTRGVAGAEATKVKQISNQIRAAWPEGAKTVTLPTEGDDKPATATLSPNGRITLTRF